MESGNLRSEITARVAVHHHQLTVAAGLSLVTVIGLVALAGLERTNLIDWFLLGVFPVFAALTFNYQSNQHTVETAARFLAQSSQADNAWEKYWAVEKKKVRLMSISKTFSLLLPQIVILGWELCGLAELSQAQTLLLTFDALLFLLVALNYKHLSGKTA